MSVPKTLKELYAPVVHRLLKTYQTLTGGPMSAQFEHDAMFTPLERSSDAAQRLNQAARELSNGYAWFHMIPRLDSELGPGYLVRYRLMNGEQREHFYKYGTEVVCQPGGGFASHAWSEHEAQTYTLFHSLLYKREEPGAGDDE